MTGVYGSGYVSVTYPSPFDTYQIPFHNGSSARVGFKTASPRKGVFLNFECLSWKNTPNSQNFGIIMRVL